jgi:hypothetical protein
MRTSTDAFAALPLIVLIGLAGCGGGSDAASTSAPEPVATPSPTPTPAAAQPAACRLSAPTVDCSTRVIHAQELSGVLQDAVDTAVGTPGVMYADVPNRIYDLQLFRSKVVDALSAGGVCGAWDYGNVVGDEIYVRSADGCVVEQYDLITGDGGVRNANRGSNVWSAEWGAPVPAPKPQFSREGDASCSLPGDRSTFCLSIRNTPGEFGPQAYALIRQVLQENPQLVDAEWALPAQGEMDPDRLRLPAWNIKDLPAYIAAVEKKLRANGFCAYIESGDILKLKSVAKGNVLHEEIDVVQNPPEGGSFVGFQVKDRCHNAGF